jgi:hypothetical protein
VLSTSDLEQDPRMKKTEKFVGKTLSLVGLPLASKDSLASQAPRISWNHNFKTIMVVTGITDFTDITASLTTWS